jgi:hypothetical protein
VSNREPPGSATERHSNDSLSVAGGVNSIQLSNLELASYEAALALRAAKT